MKNRVVVDRRAWQRCLVPLAFVLIAAACSPPQPPIEVGVKDLQTDVALGKRRPPPQVQLPQNAFGPGVTSIFGGAPPLAAGLGAGRPGTSGPAPRPGSSAAAPVVGVGSRPDGFSGDQNGIVQGPDGVTLTCPAATSSFSNARVPNTPATVSEAPIPATYQYRNRGNVTLGAAGGPSPLLSTRSVQNVTNLNQSAFSYDAVTQHGRSSIATSYLVVPYSTISNVPPQVITPGNEQGLFIQNQSGIFITQVLTTYPDGSQDRMTPEPPLKILATPTFAASPTKTYASWDANSLDKPESDVATDPSSGTRIKYSARVVPATANQDVWPINACGTVINTWKVEIRSGEIIGGGRALGFAADYYFGTQYGGLILQDDVTTRGATPTGQLDSSNLAIINREPCGPRETTCS